MHKMLQAISKNHYSYTNREKKNSNVKMNENNSSSGKSIQSTQLIASMNMISEELSSSQLRLKWT
jgi:hypothetical protein